MVLTRLECVAVGTALSGRLLANAFLHWFDVVFHRKGGPACWAKGRLVRYADDCAPGNVHAR